MNFEIIPSETAPVSLDLAKKHLNIEAEFEDDDELIQGYIDAAAADRANYMDRVLAEQRLYYPAGFCGFEFEAWADGTVSVQYATGEGEDGVEYAALPAENFTVKKVGNSTLGIAFRGTLPDLPEVDRPLVVQVDTVCPKPVVSAILLVVADLYQFRENKGEIGTNRAADALCRPYKQW